MHSSGRLCHCTITRCSLPGKDYLRTLRASCGRQGGGHPPIKPVNFVSYSAPIALPFTPLPKHCFLCILYIVPQIKQTAMSHTQHYMDVVSESSRKRGRDGDGEMESISMGLEEHRSVSPERDALHPGTSVLTIDVETNPMPSSPNIAKVVPTVVLFTPQLRL